MKRIIELNSPEIMEYLLKDGQYLETFGILECILNIIIDDPGVYLPNNAYRDFFIQEVNFMNAVDITDARILEKIRLNFRYEFFKSSVIAHWIDEITNANIMSVGFV